MTGHIFETYQELTVAIDAGTFLFKPEYAPASFRCSACAAVKPLQFDGAVGYALDPAKALVCYECCATRERGLMQRDGKITMYLVKGEAGWQVTNWPGSMRFTAFGLRRFRHPFAGDATIAYFNGPDGYVWSAKNIGDSQLAHCKRLKERWLTPDTSQE